MRDESFWEMEWDVGTETAMAEHRQKCRCLQRKAPGGSKHELETGGAWRH